VLKENIVFKKNSEIVTREIDKEIILVPTFKTSDEINSIYTLNPSASAVWNMIDGKRTMGAITKAVLKKFDTNFKDTQKKLEELFKDLKEIKAIKISGNKK